MRLSFALVCGLACTQILAPLVAPQMVRAQSGVPDPEPPIVAAFAALERNVDAARAVSVAASPLAQDVLAWVILRDGRDDQASLRDHLALMQAHPDWPVDRVMQRAAEALITDQTSDADLRAYFAQRGPMSATALRAYLAAMGTMPDAANDTLARVWPQIALDTDALNRLVAAHPSMLAPHHWARADALAWAERAPEAAAMAPLLRPDQRADLAARLAYISDAAQAGALDAGREDQPALAFARLGWLMRKGDRDGAVALIRTRSDAAGMGKPEAWAGARLRLVRWLLDQNRPQEAVSLAASSALPAGSSKRAELDWLAGRIALQDLNAPAQALVHFERLRDGVSRPISLSRAWYWIAQAHDRLGDASAAQAARAQAAAYQGTFYGQLAAEQAALPFDARLQRSALGDASLSHPSDLLRALDVLVVAGERGASYQFANALASNAAPDTLRSAAVLLLAREEYFLALRLGKAAAGRAVMLPEVYFPLHPLVDMDGVEDPALALAIARQESEFRVDAGSSAGALGLMQLMPATAERTARALGIDYAQGKLTSDWQFNARLGTAHLDELRAQFGDSPVLIAAAYNAGAGRARDWIAAHGDPRDPGTDPVAWIEAIPFAETRNYVMRVVEAMRPYEARLNGGPPTRTMAQLLRGAYPLIRPRARPDGLGQVTAPPAQATPAGVTRPRARP